MVANDKKHLDSVAPEPFPISVFLRRKYVAEPTILLSSAALHFSRFDLKREVKGAFICFATGFVEV